MESSVSTVIHSSVSPRSDKIENMSAEEYAMAYLQDPRKILEIEENLQEPWTTLNKIDLDEFMANTRPEYM